MTFGWPFVLKRRRGGRVHLLRHASWDAGLNDSRWVAACGLSVGCGSASMSPPPGRMRCRSCDRSAEEAHQRWVRSGSYPR